MGWDGVEDLQYTTRAFAASFQAGDSVATGSAKLSYHLGSCHLPARLDLSLDSPQHARAVYGYT